MFINLNFSNHKVMNFPLDVCRFSYIKKIACSRRKAKSKFIKGSFFGLKGNTYQYI